MHLSANQAVNPHAHAQPILLMPIPAQFQSQSTPHPTSRDGWAVYDDAKNEVLDPSTGWIASPTSDSNNLGGSDLYFFGHGLDYKGALSDYAKVAGSVPRLPRFLLGVWWSRYWPYTAEDLLEIAEGYRTHSLPIDVLVSDMAWHYHNESNIDWGGYNWSPELFPTPEDFISSLDHLHLNTVLNLHLEPIQHGADDKGYFDVGARLGWDAQTLKSWGYPQIPGGATLPPPYDTVNVQNLLKVNQTFGEAYLDNLDRMNTSWWWLDSSPTWAARILFEHSAKRRSDGLGIAFARWGGLGSHRYPIGFSGDTYMEWSTLQFQTYFTPTAANVMFYWSHDIGGHRSKHDTAAYDPELYLRWLQWGTHAPIFRTHPQPDPDVERRPYGYGLPISRYMGQAMRRRARLVPLLGTALREFETTALSPLRGLYIDWPSLDGAYAYKDTFLFCERLVVAPVTSNVSTVTQLAPRTVWLPPGEWISTVDGSASLAGEDGLVLVRNYTLWESPVWVHAGSMLPLSPAVESTNAVGFASRPSVVSAAGWEVWLGSARKGEGKDVSAGGANSASYTMSADNTSLRLFTTLSAPGATSTFFEVKGIYRAATVRRCGTQATVTRPDANGWSLANKTDYSATTLTQSVKIVLNKPLRVEEGPLQICVEMVGPQSMLPTSQATVRGGYVGRRLRAHRLKAMMDLELHAPHQVAMPLVIAVNSAAQIDAAIRRGNYAKANAEMASFDAQIDTALAAMANPALTGQRALTANLKAVAKAWLN